MVQGLDANWRIAEDTLNTNGISVGTAGTQTFIRVFRAFVVDVGTYGGNNTGDITIETTSGTTVAVIGAGVGQTQLSQYTVPELYTANLSRIVLEVEASNTAEIRFFQRQDADITSAPFRGSRIIFRTLEFSGSQPL